MHIWTSWWFYQPVISIIIIWYSLGKENCVRIVGMSDYLGSIYSTESCFGTWNNVRLERFHWRMNIIIAWSKISVDTVVCSVGNLITFSKISTYDHYPHRGCQIGQRVGGATSFRTAEEHKNQKKVANLLANWLHHMYCCVCFASMQNY